jgi:hypothetical protein
MSPVRNRLLAVAGMLAAVPPMLLAAASGPASAVTATPEHGSTGLIHLAIGGMCLSDKGDGTGTNNPVIIWTCNSSDKAQQWTVDADGTIHVNGPSGPELGGNGAQAVVNSTNSNTTAWVPLGNMLANSGNSLGPGLCVVTTSGGCTPGKDYAGSQTVLDDPAGSTAKGTQVQLSPRSNAANQHWTLPGEHVASTTLTNWPDSGGNGNWALDDLTRVSSTLYLGDSASGHDYLGSVFDSGTFTAFPGAYTPNQGVDKGKQIGDSLRGTAYGLWTQEFAASSFVKEQPALTGTINGVGPEATSTWENLFFPSTAKLTYKDAVPLPSTVASTGNPLDWQWYYRAGQDNCLKTETWMDTASVQGSATAGGQDSGAGDITAPAPGSSC